MMIGLPVGISDRNVETAGLVTMSANMHKFSEAGAIEMTKLSIQLIGTAEAPESLLSCQPRQGVYQISHNTQKVR